MADWVAVGIAVAVLIFTVLSFWWLYARRGHLESYEPHSFAAAVSSDVVLLRLPLVFFNTGAVPIVVQNLRLYFPNEDVPMADMPWRSSRKSLKPAADDTEDLPAVFSVPGRTALQRFIEFGGPFPAVKPERRDYTVRADAKLGHETTWTPILTFTWHAENITTPGTNLAYSNSKVPVTAEETAKANQAAKELIERLTQDRKRPDHSEE